VPSADLKNNLSNLQGKLVLVGIGNSLKADDGLGLALVQRLKNKTQAVCIDAGNTPENYLGQILKENPDAVMLVDAAQLGLPPGQYRVLQPTEIVNCGLTTHDVSGRLFIEFLQNETKASIMMLAIQPQTVAMGEKISESVLNALDELETVFIEAIG
jgi:hydrogenase 3 maturation protease